MVFIIYIPRLTVVSREAKEEVPCNGSRRTHVSILQQKTLFKQKIPKLTSTKRLRLIKPGNKRS